MKSGSSQDVCQTRRPSWGQEHSGTCKPGTEQSGIGTGKHSSRSSQARIQGRVRSRFRLDKVQAGTK